MWCRGPGSILGLGHHGGGAIGGMTLTTTPIGSTPPITGTGAATHTTTFLGTDGTHGTLAGIIGEIGTTGPHIFLGSHSK